MKRGKMSVLIVLLLICGTVFHICSYAKEDEEKISVDGKKLTHTVIYETMDQNEEKEFAKTIWQGARKYTLTTVNYEVILKPEPNVKNIKDEPYIQKVSAYTEYEYPITLEDAPQTKEVVVVNEKTGKEEIVICEIANVEQMESKWVDSYIDIQFQVYDGTAFEWQGIVIENNMKDKPLKGYEIQLLNSVGLHEDNGKVHSIYWNGDEYIENGILCRNAKAEIVKLVPVYRVNYSGEINMLIQATESVSQAPLQEKFYEMKAEAIYELALNMNYIYLGIVLLLVLIAFMLIFWIIMHHKKK